MIYIYTHTYVIYAYRPGERVYSSVGKSLFRPWGDKGFKIQMGKLKLGFGPLFSAFCGWSVYWQAKAILSVAGKLMLVLNNWTVAISCWVCNCCTVNLVLSHRISWIFWIFVRVVFLDGWMLCGPQKTSLLGGANCYLLIHSCWLSIPASSLDDFQDVKVKWEYPLVI
jgi:hypothetical protein